VRMSHSWKSTARNAHTAIFDLVIPRCVCVRPLLAAAHHVTTRMLDVFVLHMLPAMMCVGERVVRSNLAFSLHFNVSSNATAARTHRKSCINGVHGALCAHHVAPPLITDQTRCSYCICTCMRTHERCQAAPPDALLGLKTLYNADDADFKVRVRMLAHGVDFATYSTKRPVLGTQHLTATPAPFAHAPRFQAPAGPTCPYWAQADGHCLKFAYSRIAVRIHTHDTLPRTTHYNHGDFANHHRRTPPPTTATFAFATTTATTRLPGGPDSGRVQDGAGRAVAAA
jgi:hypothetical protein